MVIYQGFIILSREVCEYLEDTKQSPPRCSRVEDGGKLLCKWSQDDNTLPEQILHISLYQPRQDIICKILMFELQLICGDICKHDKFARFIRAIVDLKARVLSNMNGDRIRQIYHALCDSIA